MNNSPFKFDVDAALGSAAPAATKGRPSSDSLMEALTWRESRGQQSDSAGNPITSPKGAIGIAQVMPGTAPEAARLAGVDFDEKLYRTDAEYNKKIGRAYLDQQLKTFGDTAMALAAYNAGPGATRKAIAAAAKAGKPDSWLEYLPEETRKYVPAILAKVGGSAVKSGEYFAPQRDTYTSAKGVPGATGFDFFKEVAASAIDSVGAIGQFVGEGAAAVANKVTGTEDYVGKNLLKPASDAVRDSMTEGGKLARAGAEIKGDIRDPSTWEFPDSAESLGMVVAQGFGSLAGTLIPIAGPSARVVGLTRAARTAEAAGDAAKAAELMKAAETAARTSKVVGAGAGGAMTGGSGAEEVRQNVEQQLAGKTHEQLLAEVPVYAQAIEAGLSEDQARKSVANGAARAGGAISALFGAVGGAFNAKVLEDIVLNKGMATMLGNTVASRAGRAVVGGGVGSVAEGGQELAEKVGQNLGENIGMGLPAGQDVTRNSLGDVVAGAMVGGGIGAGGGAISSPSVAPVAAKAAEPNSPLSKAAVAGSAAAPAPTAPAPVDPAARLAELEAIGKGTPGQTLTGPDGKPVEAPGEPGRFFTPKEQAEYKALTEARDATPGAGAGDKISASVADIKRQVETGNLLDALRADGSPVDAKAFLNDLAVASSPSTSTHLREQALTRLEFAMGWAGRQPAPEANPVIDEVLGYTGDNAQRAAATTAPQRQAGVDREKDLQDRLAAATTEFERAEIRAQMETNREVKLGKPEPEVEKKAEPPKAGANEQAALEAAALAGKEKNRKAEDAPRQVVIDRALRSVEERGGVASPAEARIFQEAGIGKPYDRIDESLAPAEPAVLPILRAGDPPKQGGIQVETKNSSRDPNRLERVRSSVELTAAGPAPTTTPGAAPARQPGIEPDAPLALARAKDKAPTSTEGLGLVPMERKEDAASDKRMAELKAEREAAGAARDQANAAERQSEPPAVDSVISALKVIPALRTAEQKAVAAKARSAYTPEQMRVLTDAANAPATLSATDKVELDRLRSVRKSTTRGPARAQIYQMRRQADANLSAAARYHTERLKNDPETLRIQEQRRIEGEWVKASAKPGRIETVDGVRLREVHRRAAPAGRFVSYLTEDGVFDVDHNIDSDKAYVSRASDYSEDGDYAGEFDGLSGAASFLRGDTDPESGGFDDYEPRNYGGSGVAKSADRAPETASAKAPRPAVIPAGAEPAIVRKRRAQLELMAEMGFETVVRTKDGHFMRNTVTGRELKLDGMADAQIARQAIKAHIDKAASRADVEPTPAQVEADNYRKGQPFQLNGVTIIIENPRGSVRKSKPGAKVQWETTMKHHYGDIAGTKGADGDKVDVFVGPRPDSDKIFVIDQRNDDGEFDEHKVMMGFGSEAEARAGYLSNFDKGWTGLMAITEMTPEAFKAWVNSDAAQNPAREATNKETGDGQQDGGRGSRSGASGAEADGGGLGIDPAESITRAAAAERSAAPDVRLGEAAGANSVEIRLERGLVRLPLVKTPTEGPNAALAAIGAAVGRTVRFYANGADADRADGFTVVSDPSTIYLALDSKIHPLQVMFHEFWHTLERDNPQAARIVRDALANGADRDAWLTMRRFYPSESDSVVQEEFRADMAGVLMADPAFWQEVFSEAGPKGMVARIIAALEQMIGRALAAFNGMQGYDTAQHVKDLGNIRAAYKQALKQHIKDVGITQAAMQAEVLRAGQAAKKAPAAATASAERRPTRREIEEASWWVQRWISGSARDPEWDESWTTMRMSDAFEVMAGVVGNKRSVGNKPVWRYVTMPKKDAERVVESMRMPPRPTGGDLGDFAYQSFSESRKVAVEDGPTIVGEMPAGHVALLVSAIPSADVVAFGFADLLSSSDAAVKDALLALDDWKHQKEVILRDSSGISLFSAEILKSPDRDYTPARGSEGADRSLGQPRGVAETSRGSDAPAASYGSPQEGSVSAVGVHFGRQSRDTLSSAHYGTGLKGAERERLDGAENADIRPRIFFYVDKGNGIRPEAGVGAYAHRVELKNLYDVWADPLKLVKQNPGASNWERAIMRAGFDGYLSLDPKMPQGFAVLVGKQHTAVPTAQVVAPGQKAAAPTAPAEVREALMSKELREIDVSRIPGSRVDRSGTLIFPADSLEQANAEMERIGSATRFSRERDLFEEDFAGDDAFVEREVVVDSRGGKQKQKLGNLNSEGRRISSVKQGLQNFWDWFGDSELVDDDGRPVVLYHGTRGSFDSFETMRPTKNTGLFGVAYDAKRAGFFMTPDREIADMFADSDGGNVMPLYARMENPADFRRGLSEKLERDLEKAGFNTRSMGNAQYDWEMFDEEFGGPDLVAALKKAGYDGAIISDQAPVENGRSFVSYVAFDSEQVKSATGNRGTFGGADITKSADRNYKLDIEREDRAAGKAARLSAEEIAAVERDADPLGLADEQVRAVLKKAREDKKRFPQSEGWAPLQLVGIAQDIDPATGLPKPGTEHPKFQPIPYGFNVPPGAKRAPAKRDEAWLAKVADKFEGLIVDVIDRANAGDKNAQTIIAHQTWYRNVAEVLRRKYGGFGDLLADLLGATSPNTPVDTNWAFSLDAMRRFLRGDFNDELARFQKWLDDGKSASKFPNQHKVRQASGRLYGMNSDKAMRAMLDMWRLIEPGTSPKARNFALNLIGQSNMATIDVWAARMLRRAADAVRGASLPRIPVPAEMGVTGKWDASAKDVTGAFGFGAAVMDRVSGSLAKRGIDIAPPDLQAVAWFVEKELWGSKGWTTKTGEGGSFEERIAATPVDRYVAGWSIQQGERRPSKDSMSLAQARVIGILSGDDSVLAARAMPTLGLYAGTVESSFDTEWTAMRASHDPRMAMAEIARLAAENDQWDIFVSRVVPPKEVNANARPGVEIYFKSKSSLDAAMPILEAFTSRGQDGFTMVVDPRSKGDGEFIGVRLQYVPEISARWDEEARQRLLEDGGLEAELEDKIERLDDIAREVRLMDGVAHAASVSYDTVVVGKESYDEFIDGLAAGSDQEAGGQAWFGRPVREGLERAAARYEGNGRQDDAGRVPDAGDELRDDDSDLPSFSRERRGDRGGQDQGRGLAPLEGAPAVQGASGPDPRLVEVAERYAAARGIELRRQAEYVEVDEDRARRIAAAYDAMPHAPKDKAVKEAYADLIAQTRAQYDALVEAGYEFTFFDSASDPYAGNPWNAMRDLRANRRMAVYGTYDGYGTDGVTGAQVENNPMLAETGLRWKDQAGVEHPVLANDLFRAVHDAFGHGLEGAGFRARGEENAWQAHARMFTGPAVGAITSETRGQNSWLNYGPHGEANRNAKLEDTVFAEQKTGLMPEWTWTDGRAGDITKSKERDLDGFRKEMLGKIQANMALAKMRSDAHEWKLNVGDKLLSTKTGKVYTLTARTFQRVGKLSDNNYQPVYYYQTGNPPPANATREERDNWAEDYQQGVFTEQAILESKTLKSLTTPLMKSAERVWYSQLQRAIERVPDRLATMSAAQWQQWIKANAAKMGVKQDEVTWSGIEDYLKLRGKDKLGRDELADWVEQNGVKVEEVVLTNAGAKTLANHQAAAARLFPGVAYEDLTEEQAAQADDEVDRAGGDGDSRYSQYTLPGGTNYREVLLTLPEKAPNYVVRDRDDGAAESVAPDGSLRWWPDRASAEAWVKTQGAQERINRGLYRSGHWDQPNILAHARLNDRTDADGKRVLFVNEIQSDWGQEGKKKGFADPAKKRVAVKKSTGDQETVARFATGDEAQAYIDARPGERLVAWVLPSDSGPPVAPFVTKTDAWVALALKRIVKMAVDGGYDKVALITGQQAADLYDISKQLDRVSYGPSENAHGVVVGYRGSNPVISKNVGSDEEVADVIGKEAAQKLLSAQPDKYNVRQLRGLDLKVGGEGMRAFYDQIVPQVARDVLKKVGGGQVGKVNIAAPNRYTGPVSGVDVMKWLGIPREQMSSYWADHASERDKLIEQYRNRNLKDGGQDQPGFEITDKMRAATSGGMATFSSSRNLTETPEFKAWFGDSKVVDENGKPLVVYHGTTHNFTEFRPRKTNVGNDFGRGIYATSSQEDASANYAGEGPDLTGRIELRAEQIAGDNDWEYNDPRAIDLARKELSGGSDNVMPLYLRIENPLVLGGDKPTRMDERAAMKFARSIDKAVRQQEIDTRGAGAQPGREALVQLDDLMEAAYDGADADVLIAKGKNAAAYLEDLRTGELISAEVVRKAIQAAGYDGIIDHTVSKKWGADSGRKTSMAGVTKDTTHYIAFKADQAKSAIGNSGAFDPSSRDITKSAERIDTPEFKAWFGSSKVTKSGRAGGEPRVVYHGTNASFKSFDPRMLGGFSAIADGFYFTSSEDEARSYGETVMPVYLSLQNPAPRSVWGPMARAIERGETDSMLVRERLEGMGYDGISGPDDMASYLDARVYVAFYPEQIRNADITKSAARDVTETDAFKRWFGGSKVVDENGKPLVLYHGTAADFQKFKTHQGAGGELGAGAYFTPDPKAGSTYAAGWDDGVRDGANVMPVYLAMRNPFDATGQDTVPTRKALMKQGYDGIIDRSAGGGTQYVAFRPEQIKSAIGNNGKFDPTNPSITKSGDRALEGGAGDVTSAQEHWPTPGASKFDDFVYKLQDKHVDTKRVVESIKEVHGAIRDDLDVYLQEELFHGRAAKRTDDFVHKELEPLIKDMAERGLTIEELDEYLHARHAREANAVIRARNPELADGGSGLDDADADAYFDQLGADKLDHLKAAAVKVDAMLKRTRNLLVDYELVSKAQVKSWGEMFEHYVPLMREDEGGHSGNGTGQGFSIKGKEVKSRTGSKRKVVDILANIAMQRERAIVRGEKNRVSRALFGLAAANDNADFWQVDTHIPSEQVFNPKTGLVEDRPDNLFKQRPNVIVTKMADEAGNVSERAIIFNEKNERAVRMAESLKNLDAAQLEGLLGASARITRYFASVNTQYNPVFGIVNLVRDVQGAMVNLANTELAGKQKEIARQTASALGGIYKDLRAVRKGGTASSNWAALWEDFQDVGGQTGYRDLFRTSEDRAKAIEAALDPTAWMDSKLGRIFTAGGALKVPLAAAQRGAKWIFDWLSDYNSAMENGVRLATYKAGLDAGLSKERAASIAKNLTVNFNRKGQVAQQAGALYAFFNASAQGTARLGQVLFDMEPGKPKTIRLSSLGKKVVYGGMLLGSVQAMAMAAAGFGDDDPPEWARERSLIIPVGDKKYVTIPLPLGLHVIPNIGRVTTAWALSGFKDTPKRVVGLLGSLADAFNPIGNAGMSMQTLAPTALDPLVALTENRDWSGRPIARESSNKAIPGHALARDTSSTVGKVLAEAINYLSGGTKYTAGVMSPTPDQIDFLVGQVTGGVGRELSKVEQSLLGAAHGETVPIYKVPVVGRFVGNAKSQASEGNAFYANVDRLNELETEIKGMRKDGKLAEANELRLKSPQAYLITQANHAEQQVQKLRRQKTELVKAGAPREQVKAIEVKITERMAALNRAVEALEAR